MKSLLTELPGVKFCGVAWSRSMDLRSLRTGSNDEPFPGTSECSWTREQLKPSLPTMLRTIACLTGALVLVGCGSEDPVAEGDGGQNPAPGMPGGDRDGDGDAGAEQQRDGSEGAVDGAAVALFAEDRN